MKYNVSFYIYLFLVLAYESDPLIGFHARQLETREIAQGCPFWS